MNQLEQAKQVLAKKFNLKPKDFISFPFNGQTAIVCTYGIHRGSWNEVMKAKDWTITIDGKKYDTRTSMTKELYKARYKAAKKQNIPLPDSIEAKTFTDNQWSWTSLTGEKLSGGTAPSGVVDVNGRVRFRLNRPGRGDDGNVRVAPAVVIDSLSFDVSPSLDLEARVKNLEDKFEKLSEALK